MINQNEMDRKLYSSLWISQCKQIDTELLTFEDTILIQKCIHQEPVDDAELEQLRLLLSSYNKIDKEYNVSEMEDNIQGFQDQISNEQAFLDLIDNANTDKKIVKEYEDGNGKKVQVKFIVHPVMDSRVVYDIIDHADVFAKLDVDEQQLYAKANTSKLTSKEQELLDKLNVKVQGMLMTGDNLEFLVDNFLAKQVELEDSTLTSNEERLEFWSKVDPNIKLDLFNTVKEMIVSSGGVGSFL